MVKSLNQMEVYSGFAHKRVYTKELLHTEAFTQRSDYTESFYTQTRSHTVAFTNRSLYTEELLQCTHRCCYTKKSLHREL